MCNCATGREAGPRGGLVIVCGMASLQIGFTISQADIVVNPNLTLTLQAWDRGLTPYADYSVPLNPEQLAQG